MGRAERVVFALAALGEAGQPAFLPQRADAVAPAGQDLVRIGLVADVPDQPVVGRVEDVVQRDGQLDDAEPRAEMAAGDRYRVDQLGAQFGGELRQSRLRASVRRSAGTRTLSSKWCFRGDSGAAACLTASGQPEIGPRRPKVNARCHAAANANPLARV